MAKPSKKKEMLALGIESELVDLNKNQPQVTDEEAAEASHALGLLALDIKNIKAMGVIGRKLKEIGMIPISATTWVVAQHNYRKIFEACAEIAADKTIPPCERVRACKVGNELYKSSTQHMAQVMEADESMKVFRPEAKTKVPGPPLTQINAKEAHFHGNAAGNEPSQG